MLPACLLGPDLLRVSTARMKCGRLTGSSIRSGIQAFVPYPMHLGNRDSASLGPVSLAALLFVVKANEVRSRMTATPPSCPTSIRGPGLL